MKKRRIITSGIVAAVLSTGTLIAQSQSSAQPPAQKPSNADRVTVTGCIERADQLSASGGSTIGTTVDSLDFVLIKADAQSGSSSASRQATPTGTSGTSGAASASVGPMYRLEAEVEDLNPHVGHRVEIVGTREATAAAAGAAQADAANPHPSTAPRLHVESVKMLSESCPR
jgi:hypothetical protein